MEACKPSKTKIFLTCGYSILILLSSLIPMDQSAESFRFFLSLKPAVQNLLHIPAFAILSILCLQVLGYSPMDRTRKLIRVLMFSVAFGIVNEWVQFAIPSRYPGSLEIMLNSVGSALGMLVYLAAESRQSGLIRRLVCG